ncbi:transcriptional regulator, GntR family [Tistlia consotensis]|uniref:Transcriptional regulator, GntR family n=1 Tax=Tistlia consotensis USBA 355 TaxID=560819 RepID=A0A1Y6BA84_9PROT|nr:GntR family transcriptional regulator [Tistlia consotensis]SME97415.1 transcriptional regulator, GntR family [Tistlia consotensis USBA 355]SNR56752.1 transcriptional regulator, GntR family [Tistlia consotensis]
MAKPDEGKGSLYERMREDILRLSLRPGQDLDETTLAERYNVSRTPIREALIRLSADRLIVFSRNRGARVTPLILPDFPRFLEALGLLQRAVARLAAYRHHASDVARLDESLAALTAFAQAEDVGDDRRASDIVAAEKAHLLRIAEAGHNGYLRENYESLLTIGLRMMRLPFAYSPPMGRTVAEYLRDLLALHAALLDAVRRGDAAAAETAAAEVHRALVLRLREYNEENLVADVSIATGTDD